ncbi:AAA family ATPase [Sulfolobus sp. E5-1-F]|uniref:ATP-binding protein n=1 Tax=Saccharolobus sp. E5-1-F TaxID=2663019 RepID=UPI0012981F8C|nr:ATP-binding protein [Sulfolobus sp. E5-1-F]QGA55500.1 AAA family ATPase [Sulfolobus sp. E5-1-F]
MSFQNPWWIDRNKILEDEHVKKAKVIISPINENALILGPRQVGKTTFLKTTIKTLLEREDPKSILFFTCDAFSRKEELIGLINEYRTLINREKRAYIFLDEITSIDDWNNALLHLFNAFYFNNSLVYVTGSSSINLRKEMLPGRPIKKYAFYPLNFRVYFNTFYRKLLSEGDHIRIDEKDKIYELAINLSPYISELNKALLEYVKRGGFFATLFSENPLSLYEIYKDAILSEFLKTERKENLFKFITRKLIESYGSRISDNTIAKDLNVSHTTVGDYLDVMEKLFIIRVFRKVENNEVNYRSLKKVYFIDPFFFRVMKIYSVGKDVEEYEIPLIIEGIVGEHLAREYKEVGYLHFKSSREVDFYVNNVKVEVKWREKEHKKYNKVDFLLTIDEFKKSDHQVTLPISIFLYLISSDKVFYEI